MHPSHLLRNIGHESLITLRGFKSISNDFQLHKDFLNLEEQRVMLSACLQKLDSQESPRARRNRRRLVRAQTGYPGENSTGLMKLFAPEESYEFEKGHFDGVIHNYRETTVTSWTNSPMQVDEKLLKTIQRIQKLLPSSSPDDIQTHILHLSAAGEILPHVDNVEASGPHILGVSLGATRIMSMESSDHGAELGFDVLLPSGSVYIQSHSIRYGYTHSILKEGMFKGQKIPGGPRVSLMIRVNTFNQS